MKYPKPWEAGSPAGRPYVASGRDVGFIQLATHVNRPGTPHHTRLIRTHLSVAEATRLRDELTLFIDRMARGAAAKEPGR
jgi:hypothetical protein